MLEILLVIGLCRRIGRTVAAKGRRCWPWQLLLVGVWFGAEIVGGVIAFIVIGDDAGAEPYLIGIGAAIVGAILVSWRVRRLPSLAEAELSEVFE